MFEAVYSKSILGLASEQSRAIDSRHVLCCLFLQDKREGRVQQTSIGNGTNWKTSCSKLSTFLLVVLLSKN